MVIEFDVDDEIGELIQNEAKSLNLSVDEYLSNFITEWLRRVDKDKI